MLAVHVVHGNVRGTERNRVSKNVEVWVRFMELLEQGAEEKMRCSSTVAGVFGPHHMRGLTKFGSTPIVERVLTRLPDRYEESPAPLSRGR